MEKFRFIIFGNYYDMWTAVNRFGWHKMYKKEQILMSMDFPGILTVFIVASLKCYMK